MSENKTAIERLAEIQQQLKVPKDAWNDFGKYKYRNASSILETVKPLFLPGEAILDSEEMVLVGDRYYVKATVTFHSGNDSVSVTSFAREPQAKKGMDEAQITGSCSTYAKKYALCNMLAIDDSKDDPDATNDHGKGSGDAHAGGNQGQDRRSPADRAKPLPAADKLPQELELLLSPVAELTTAEAIALAQDDLRNQHSRRSWRKDAELWLERAGMVLGAEDRQSVRQIYDKFLDDLGGYKSKSDTKTVAHSHLVGWMQKVCETHVHDLSRAA